MKKYEKRLESAYNEYIDKIEKIAEEARQDYLIPYLDKMDYSFSSGNGTYTIFDHKEKYDYYHFLMDELPEKIKNILELEVNDRGNSELGLWMEDYRK